MGFRCRGNGKEPRVLGARRPAPVRPPLRPGQPPLFLPGCPVLSSLAPCLGGSWEPGSSAGREHGISRAAAGSRLKPRPPAPELGELPRQTPPDQAARRAGSRGAAAAAASSLLPELHAETRLQPKNPF